MSSRILLVNRFASGQHVPTGRMLADLTHVLKRQGAHVTVFTGRGEYSGTSDRHDVAVAADKIVRPPRLLGDSFRPVSWIWFWLCFPFWWVFVRGKFEHVVVLTDPPFLPFWFGVVPRPRALRRITWWTMDLYPEALLAAGKVRPGGVVHRFLRWLNDVGLRGIDAVVTLSRAQLGAVEGYRSFSVARPARSMVLAPWDIRPVAPIPIEDNLLVDEMGWRGKRVVLYAGNLGEAHDATALVSAARQSSHCEEDPWHFVFAIRGSRKASLISETRDLKNVEVHDYFPEARTAELLSAAAVHVVTLREEWKHVLVPSKLFGALATGRPVLFLGPTEALDTFEGVRVLDHDSPEEAILATLEELAGSAIPTDRLRAQQEAAVQRLAAFVTAD